MNIPKISSTMLKHLPDQTSDILNRLIAEVNAMEKLVSGFDARITALEEKPAPDIIDREWHQVLIFDPTQMGTEPGWCLANVDAGFGITDGTYPTARADMLAQQANGTLHVDMPPPDWLAVPVYVDTGTPNGHVVVWDCGTVWSDGAIVPDGLAHYSVIYGWGELCDGHRVVSKDG